jgi:hypothetical protein
VLAATENLLYTNVVDVEFNGVAGEGVDSGLANETGEMILKTKLLGGNN